jgi:predicted RNA polymerase sigma factor
LVTTLEQVFRDQWGRVLAALIGLEAFAIAAERWPHDEVPANPGAWLMTTARNRAVNRIRRDRTLAAKARLLQVPQAAEDTMDATAFPDERLELIFTCCHPALPIEGQVALTLRTLGGLTTGEIARAFRVPSRPWPSGWSGPSAGSRPPGSRSGLRRPGRDWPQIAALYGELSRLTGSPVVELNRAVAAAERRLLQRRLAELDTAAGPGTRRVAPGGMTERMTTASR